MEANDYAPLHEAKRCILEHIGHAIPAFTPEASLVLAVFDSAIFDAYINRSTCPREGRAIRSARAFWKSQDFVIWCDSICVDPEWALGKIRLMDRVVSEMERNGQAQRVRPGPGMPPRLTVRRAGGAYGGSSWMTAQTALAGFV